MSRVRGPGQKWEAIVAYYREAILVTEELRGGDRLPAQLEMCRLWGVSKTTMVRATRELRAEGLVVGGRGPDGLSVSYTPRSRTDG